jgi:hypothetical protein
MKTLVFKYFDKFYLGELCEDLKHNRNGEWVEVKNGPIDGFGYDRESKIVYYHEDMIDITRRIFNISKGDFRQYFADWFSDRYKLKVTCVF